MYFSYYESRTSQFEYSNQFACDSFIAIFKNLIIRKEGELAALGYVLVANLCISSDKMLSMIYQSDFLQTSFEKFKSGNANYTELVEAIRFFALLCKGENKFSYEQIAKFIKIFDTACRPGEEEETIFYALGGIVQFIKKNSEHKNQLVMLLLQLNTVQKILQCDDDKMETRGRSFVYFAAELVDYIVDAISPNINAISQFIENCNVLTAFNRYLSRPYPHEVKRRIIDVVNKLISLKDLGIIFLFAKNPIANAFAKLLTNSDFNIITESIKILNLCFATCNYDILSLLHQQKVIDEIVSRMKKEKDETNLRSLLECVYYFLQNDGNSFAIYCAKIGVEDVLSKQTNFTASHFALIEKIRTLMLNKIN